MAERREDKLENMARGLNAAAPVPVPTEKKTAARRPKLKKENFTDFNQSEVIITPKL
jgi:hypothetical protein